MSFPSISHRLVAALLCCGCLSPAASGELLDTLSWDGFVETYQALQLAAPQDTQGSRARARLRLYAGEGDRQLFARITAERDLAFEGNRIELDEGYLDLVGRGWDARLGRQVVIWGRADGLRIVDRVSTLDSSESLTRELDEVRLGVDALRLRRLDDSSQITLIWSPRFRPGRAPSEVWALPDPVPEGVARAGVERPGSALDEGVFAARWSYYGAGLDLAVSVLHTWEDLPSLDRESGADGALTLVPRHHRLTLWGLEFARPWQSFVFRGEAVYIQGQRLEPADWRDPLRREDLLHWMLGLDWTPGNNWTLIAQVSDAWIPGYGQGLASEAHTPVLTLGLSADLLRETLEFSNLLFVRPNEQGYYNRLSLDYAVTDRFHAGLGLDLFGGEEGAFAFYKENDQLWLKLKYSF
ncbi:MAG: hypothetical protein J7D61_05195 [Marichromatium sp.]|nr:hypothetical protein [Marichromatium sp.]